MEYGLSAVFGVLIGFLGAFFSLKKISENQKNLYREILEKEIEKNKTLEKQKEDLQNLLTKHIAQNGAMESELKSAKEYSQKIKEEFRLIALETMQKTASQNKYGVEETLKPLKEQLESFRKKIDEAYIAESTDRKLLAGGIKELNEQNIKLAKEASNLADALKNKKKTQGLWGEMVLEGVLSSSGLREGEEYILQTGERNDDGERIIPDAVINLPDGKKIVIDSKVTLNSYLDYSEADDEEAKAAALKSMLTAMKKHIDTLGAKKYTDIKNAFEYVFMFVPVEGAYLLAISEDRGLFEGALKKGVVLITASSLMTTLKTVYMIWRSERQNQNAQQIAKEAGAVYDKMFTFLAEFEKISANIERAQKSYDEAKKLLVHGTGAAIGRLQRLKELGAVTQKNMDDKIEFVDLGENL